MNWNTDMTVAPKDRPILALCEHDADPYFLTDDEKEKSGRKVLTAYGGACEGMSHVKDGPNVLVWGGGGADTDEYGAEHASWPDWWFQYGSDFEVAAFPVAWCEIPEYETETRHG